GADVTGLNPPGAEGAGVLVGTLVHFAVAETLAAVDQEIPVAEAIHLGFQAVGHTVALARLDSGGGHRTQVQLGLGLFAAGQHSADDIVLPGHGCAHEMSSSDRASATG